MNEEIKCVYSETEKESTPYHKEKGRIEYTIFVGIYECSLTIGSVVFIRYLGEYSYKVMNTYHNTLIEEESISVTLSEEGSFVSSPSRAIRLGIATFDKYKIRALKHIPVIEGKVKKTKEDK